MQAGAFAGALLANPLADHLGRRPGLLIVSVFAFIGGLLQAFSYCIFSCFYVGRFVEGLGLGGATMLAPTYVSENSPRGIRGLLIGFYQLFETMGAMIAFFIDYGSLLHIKGHASWIVPLAMQSLPPVLIFVSILFCPESPRWLASKDNWESASSVLATVRHLPVEHPYVQQELLELRTQLEEERRSIHGTGFWATQKECWLIPGNRKRALMSIGLVCLSSSPTPIHFPLYPLSSPYSHTLLIAACRWYANNGLVQTVSCSSICFKMLKLRFKEQRQYHCSNAHNPFETYWLWIVPALSMSI